MLNFKPRNRSLRLNLTLISACLFQTHPVVAQVREVWMAHYGGGGSYAFASAIDFQGDLVVTGMSGDDYLTVKYNQRNGQEVWTARYGGSGNDFARSVKVDGSGHVIVTGFSAGSGTGNDYATVKYDGRTGQLLWVSRYNGPANAGDSATAVALDSAGHVFVTGSSSGMGSGGDYATIKYDGNTGEQLWVARYSSSGNVSDTAWAVVTDWADNVYVTGNSGTIKYDGRTGQQLWIHTPSAGRAIAVDRQGDVFVTGGDNHYRTYKIHGLNGQQIWTATTVEDGGGSRTIAITAVGDVCITGGRSGGAPRSFIVKYKGSTGQLIWIQTLMGWSEALAIDWNEDVYVSGSSFSNFPGPVGNFRTVKLDGGTGRLLWERTHLNAQAHAVIVDGQGNVYVAGHEGQNLQEQYLTIKYEQAPPGDVDFDFCVDDVDMLRVLLAFGESGDLPEDVDRDGVVDDKDLLTVLFNFGRGCAGE